jgi:preprotein translocase subunit SecB
MTMPSDTGQNPPESPQLRVLSQYVKELSFRNALASASAQAYNEQPMIDMGVEVKSRPIGERSEATEVDLCINVQARRGEEPMFSVELVYAGLFQFINTHPQDIEPMVWIECPRLLFPFARQIMAEVTREGGYPPLMINPIDFTPLYYAELKDREERGAAPLGG